MSYQQLIDIQYKEVFDPFLNRRETPQQRSKQERKKEAREAKTKQKIKKEHYSYAAVNCIHV